MGKVKEYLEYALDILQVSHEEIEGLSLLELEAKVSEQLLLTEHTLEDSIKLVNEQLDEIHKNVIYAEA